MVATMTTSRLVRRAALGAAFALLLGPAGAARYTVTGAAPVDAGPVAAREMALRDAEYQAAVFKGAHLQSSQRLDNAGSSESGRLQPDAGPAPTYRVLREGVRNSLYEVTLEIDDAPLSATAASRGRTPAPGPVCNEAGARPLKRRVIATYFHLLRSAQAPDLPGLGTGVPAELARRLSLRPAFSGLSAATLALVADPQQAEPLEGAETVREIGRREDAQFVVAGRVIDTSVTGRRMRPVWFGSPANGVDPSARYEGPFAGLLGMGVQNQASERQFEIELWIYDAFTGAVLANDRLAETARGEVMPAWPLAFGTQAFWNSDYGRAVSTVMDRAVTRLAETTGCIPFAARVARVEQRRVYLNAGGLDGLEVGDRLLVYKPRPATMIRSAGNTRALGVPETLVGDVELVQVQPKLSIGVVNNARLAVEAGDHVRFVPRR